MNIKIKTLSELRDSRMMYEKNPPAFGYFFILIITFLIISITFWSIKTPKTYEILANGTVTNEEANYVMCSYTGEVDICNLQEGLLVEKGDILLSIKCADYDLQEEQLMINRAAYMTKKEKYCQLVKSIKDDKNYFDASDPEDALYYSIYEGYKAQIEQSSINTNLYSAYGYTSEQIEDELGRNQSKISQIYYDAITNAENAINEAELYITSIDAQLAALKSGHAEHIIRATASGVLHLLSDLKSGMVVQTTMSVATITPQNAEVIVDAFVSTADMARIHVGDEAKITIDGLIQNVYGSLNGRIKQIDSDVTYREFERGTMQGFRIKVSLDEDYLISTAGEKINIVNGMTAVARITYDQVSYFDFVIDKLGIKVK